MKSELMILNEKYDLYSNKLVCNKLGFAQFFIDNYSKVKKEFENGKSVLDVGCGIGPLSLFLATVGLEITGIDLNPIAIELAIKNFNEYNQFVKLIQGDFSTYNFNEKFDILVSNPPIFFNNDSIDLEQILRNLVEERIDDNAFKFLTNSWTDNLGNDLVDYIFNKANFILSEFGKVVIITGDIDIDSKRFILNKANNFNYYLVNELSDEIVGESLGLPPVYKSILAHILIFKKSIK